MCDARSVEYSYFAVLAAHFAPCAMLARSSTFVHSLRCASCKTQTASTITRKICANFAFYASLRSAGDVEGAVQWWRLVPPCALLRSAGKWGARYAVVAAGAALRLASLGGDRLWAFARGRVCWCACPTCPTCPTCPNGRAGLIFLQKNLSTLGFRT